MFLPAGGQSSRRGQAREHFGGQELVTQSAVEALDVAVLLPWDCPLDRVPPIADATPDLIASSDGHEPANNAKSFGKTRHKYLEDSSYQLFWCPSMLATFDTD
jgi:hypothetical protein